MGRNSDATADRRSWLADVNPASFRDTPEESVKNAEAGTFIHKVSFGSPRETNLSHLIQIESWRVRRGYHRSINFQGGQAMTTEAGKGTVFTIILPVEKERA